MKKSTMEALVAYIDNNNLTDLFSIKDELTAELAKSKAKADENRALYAEIHDKVVAVLKDALAPVSAQELENATKVSKGKLVYGLSRLWTDEIAKDNSGKTTTYFLK